MKSSDFLFGKAYARVQALKEVRRLTTDAETLSARSALGAHMERLNAAAEAMTAEEHADVFLHLKGEIDRTDDVGPKATLCLLAAAEAGLVELKTMDSNGKSTWADRARMMEWHAVQLGAARKH